LKGRKLHIAVIGHLVMNLSSLLQKVYRMGEFLGGGGFWGSKYSVFGIVSLIY
jgi:hypothetical protein